MRGYIAVTDNGWASYLSAMSATEVNFWFPSAEQAFRALQVGDPFLFKTHFPDNQIVGGGYFEHFTILRASEAWAFLGEGNGVPDVEHLIARVARYRRADPGIDPVIGCVILNDVVWFTSPPTAPASFARNIVRGKSYALPAEDSEVEQAFSLLLSGAALSQALGVLGPTRGEPTVVVPRLGQGAFQAVVLDAYQARCAITGHRIRPTLQAAHIRPVAAGGQHRVDNGLLLRSDVHTMFDRGYLTVDDQHRLRVSPRLRREFANGDEFYARDGESILLPPRPQERPNAEFLEWHQDSVFLAS